VIKLNVLLVDADSKIPNLALMKLSAYHKARGDKVALKTLGANISNTTDKEMPDADKIYMSIVFKRNRHLIDGIRFYYTSVNPNIEIDIGGSGYNLDKWLPDEVEKLKPDYDLYKGCDSSYGYASRGCDRNCPFCIVPKKEGKFRRWQHPSEFYDKRFRKIFFFDNNILWDKKWFRIVCKFCIDRKLKVWFNQGLDLRLLNESDVSWLLALDRNELFEFAWDDIKLENVVEKKIKMLNDCGLNVRAYGQVYVYCDSDAEFDSALYRCRKLKEWGANPYIMFNIDNVRTTRISHLIQWANNKFYFWGCEFEEYYRDVEGRDKRQKTIDNAWGL
jgi:hypothetical protein